MSHIVRLTQLIDSTYPTDLDPEAWLWRRCLKVAEETGELTAAILGMIRENPRKGRTHRQTDVELELLDVALAALGAYAHVTEHRTDPLEDLEAHARRVRVRLEVAAMLQRDADGVVS